MDFNKTLKENVENLKIEINALKYMQRKSYRKLKEVQDDADTLATKIITGEPLEKFDLENDLRIIRYGIKELKNEIKRLKSVRIDLESEVGAEYIGFGKKKLLEMKEKMLNHGIDILRKRFTLTNYNKDEVDIFVESVMGYDTVRIEGGKPTFNIVFGYVNKVLKTIPFPYYVYKIKQLIFKVNKDLTLKALPDKKISNDDMNFEIYQNADKGQSGLASNYDYTSHYLSSPIIPVNRYGINNYGIELKKTGSGNNYLIGSTYIYRPINFEENAQSGFIKNIPSYTDWSYGYNEYQGYANGRHNITLDETGKMIRYNESIWKRRSDSTYLLRYKNENEQWIDIENFGNTEGLACLGNGKIISKYTTLINTPKKYITTKTGTRTFTGFYMYDGVCGGHDFSKQRDFTLHYEQDVEISDYSYRQDILYKFGNYDLAYNGYNEFTGILSSHAVSPVRQLDNIPSDICYLITPNPSYIWGSNPSPQYPITKSANVIILDYDNYNGDENFCIIYEYITSNPTTSKYILQYKTNIASDTITILENNGHIQNVSCQIFKDKFITYTATIVPTEGSVYTIIGMINLSMEGIEEKGHKQFIMPTEYIPPSDIQYLGLDGSRFIGIHRGTLVNKEEGD